MNQLSLKGKILNKFELTIQFRAKIEATRGKALLFDNRLEQGGENANYVEIIAKLSKLRDRAKSRKLLIGRQSGLTAGGYSSDTKGGSTAAVAVLNNSVNLKWNNDPCHNCLMFGHNACDCTEQRSMCEVIFGSFVNLLKWIKYLNYLLLKLNHGKKQRNLNQMEIYKTPGNQKQFN